MVTPVVLVRGKLRAVNDLHTAAPWAGSARSSTSLWQHLQQAACLASMSLNPWAGELHRAS